MERLRKTMARFPSAVITARRAVVLFALLATACAGEREPPRSMHVSVSLVEQVVRLAVRDIPPGREITALVLVDGGGGETPARDREILTREQGSGGNAGPGVGIGASGGSSSGISPYISLGYLFRNDETSRRSRSMTAEIPLADPAAYAAGYRDWRIVVRYRDQLGELQSLSVPAPPP